MSLVEQAFKELYPKKKFKYNAYVVYSERLEGFNACLIYGSKRLEFRLSKRYASAPRRVKLGILQVLLLRCFGRGEKPLINTSNIRACEDFINNVSVKGKRKG